MTQYGIFCKHFRDITCMEFFPDMPMQWNFFSIAKLSSYHTKKVHNKNLPAAPKMVGLVG